MHYTLYFCWLFLRILFVKKAFDAAMSKTKLHLFITYNHYLQQHSMAAVSNAHLLAITDINTFHRNKSCWEAITKYQKLNDQKTLAFLCKYRSTKSCQKVELMLCKLLTALACQDFMPRLSQDCSLFYFHGWIVWLCSRWVKGCGKSQVGGRGVKRGIWSQVRERNQTLREPCPLLEISAGSAAFIPGVFSSMSFIYQEAEYGYALRQHCLATQHVVVRFSHKRKKRKTKENMHKNYV